MCIYIYIYICTPTAQLAKDRLPDAGGLGFESQSGASPLQASGGISTLQSTTQGNFIQTQKRLLRVKNKQMCL